MKFLDLKLKQQKATILLITPRVSKVYGAFVEFRHKHSDLSESEKTAQDAAEKYRAAKIDLEKLEKLAALDGTPERITEVAEAKLETERLLTAAEKAKAAAAYDAERRSAEMLTDVVNFLLDEHYEDVLCVLAALYGIEASKLEEEKGLLELVEMIFETLGDEALCCFFPQLRRFRQKMQSAT